MIYFLYGDNDYQIDQRVASLRQQFVQQHGPNNLTVIDVTRSSALDIMEQLTARSLLSDQRMVIISAITSTSEGWTLLEKTLDYIPGEVTVVLTHHKLLSKIKNLTISRTFKKLQSCGATLEKLAMLTAKSVQLWLAQEVIKRDLQMDQTAQMAILRLTAGEDNQQARLMIELDKLALLSQPITSQLVDQLIEPSLQTNAFTILGTALSGQVERAITLLRHLRDSGEDPNRFLGLLASQELALATAIVGGDIKLAPFQISQAKRIAATFGSKAEQLTRLGRITTALAKLDAELKLSTPEQAWLRVEITLAQLTA